MKTLYPPPSLATLKPKPFKPEPMTFDHFRVNGLYAAPLTLDLPRCRGGRGTWTLNVVWFNPDTLESGENEFFFPKRLRAWLDKRQRENNATVAFTVDDSGEPIELTA